MNLRNSIRLCALSVALLGTLAPAAPVVLDNVPAYDWYHGCGPTSAGSIVGYWDLAGLPNLFSAAGSAVYLTGNVQDQISSPAHNAKYDPTPDIADTILPVPASTSIAGWFNTSVAQPYGWSYQYDAPTAFTGYFSYRGYAAAANSTYWSSLTWSSFTAQIDAGRPVLLLVDTDSDNASDHFVPAFGYEDRGAGGKWYACYDSWGESETVLWKQFRGMSSTYSWGIYAATIVTPPFQWSATTGNWSSAAKWSTSARPSGIADSAWIDSGTCTMDTTAGLTYTYVGWRRSGTLIHTGSLSTQALRIGEYAGSRGVFQFQSGALNVGDLSIGNAGTAVMSVTGANLRFRVTGRFHLGAAGRFDAAPGSAMTMSGTSFEIAATDPSAALGFGNLRVDLETGFLNKCSVEVAGLDLGLTTAGFQGNFAIGSLHLDGTLGGSLELVNATANAAPGGVGEALYVTDLALGTDSRVELGGLPLYYLSGGVPHRLIYGDANLDGTVDQADYTVWYNHYGSLAGWLGGDFSGNGMIDQADYTLWYNHYGEVARGDGAGGFGGFPPSPAPEPAALTCLLLGAGLLFRRRKMGRSTTPKHRSRKTMIRAV